MPAGSRRHLTFPDAPLLPVWYALIVTLEAEHAAPKQPVRFSIRRDLAFFGVVAAILIADQVLKQYITWAFDRGDYWPSRDWFVRVTYVENRGAAFGVLQNQGVFLIGMTLVGLGAIIAYYLYPPFEHGVLRLALALILGGAIGNLVDRVRQGYVVDFINTSFWPTFNLADSCISIGMVLLLTFMLFAPKDPPPRQASQGAARDGNSLADA